LLRRLDRAAEQINPFLMMIAIGLAVPDVSRLIALLDTGTLALRRAPVGTYISAYSAGAVAN
jgi:hypothetical protein